MRKPRTTIGRRRFAVLRKVVEAGGNCATVPGLYRALAMCPATIRTHLAYLQSEGYIQRPGFRLWRAVRTLKLAAFDATVLDPKE